MHLKQPEFTYIASEPFSKNYKNNKKNKEREDLGYIYQHELDKACFKNVMAFADFKDLNRRTTADKV